MFSPLPPPPLEFCGPLTFFLDIILKVLYDRNKNLPKIFSQLLFDFSQCYDLDFSSSSSKKVLFILVSPPPEIFFLKKEKKDDFFPYYCGLLSGHVP